MAGLNLDPLQAIDGISFSGISLLPVSGSPWPGVRYGCTTRLGGVSRGPWGSLNLGLHTDDDPPVVHENRRRLVECLPSAPTWLEQVHGTDTVVVDSPPLKGVEPACADAAITTRSGCVLAILTADCAPVVIADGHGRAVGVAHAGWRGLAAGVLESTFEALQKHAPAATSWRAWVGPCIGQVHFEVGEEVRRAFLESDPTAETFFDPGRAQGKWQADLPGLVALRLRRLGISNIELSGLCSYGREDLFFSYRRSGRITGRMATLAWLEAPL